MPSGNVTADKALLGTFNEEIVSHSSDSGSYLSTVFKQELNYFE